MNSVSYLVSLLLLVNVSLLSGVMKLLNPEPQVQFMLSRGFPKLLKLASLPPLTTANATLLIQVTGGLLALLSALVLLNVARGFSAFLLGLIILGITVSMHVNIDDPAKTPEAEQIQVLKNLSMVGGLWVVAALSGRKASAKVTSPKVSVKAKTN